MWEKGQKIGFFTLQFRIYRAVTSSLALCDLLKVRLPRHPPPPFPEPLSKGGDGGRVTLVLAEGLGLRVPTARIQEDGLRVEGQEVSSNALQPPTWCRGWGALWW